MTTQPLLQLDELKRNWIDDAIAKFNAVKWRGAFTADDLHRYLPPPTHDGWWGCLVAKLRKAGRIREIGRVKSSRPERNGAKITLWQTV
jgi:hypothetical protein